MKLVENRIERLDYTNGLSVRSEIDQEDTAFLVKHDGSWLHKGSLITKKPMICLFASMLTRDAEGHYFLESAFESLRIDVEDAPLIIVGMTWCGRGHKQELHFITNTDQCITAGPQHELRVASHFMRAEPVPYLHVRNGKGGFPVEARLNRPTYYELMALAEPDLEKGEDVLGVWSGGVFFPVGGLPKESTALI